MVERGWFIRSREPNNLFWSLQADVRDGWTQDPAKALLFARRLDADSYFTHHFHEAVKSNFEVGGVN